MSTARRSSLEQTPKPLRSRLRSATRRLRSALAAARAPGYAHIESRVAAARRAMSTLGSTLDEAARAGLSVRKPIAPALAPCAVFKTVGVAVITDSALGNATLRDFSGVYGVFAHAAERMADTADAVLTQGVEAAPTETPGVASL